MEYLAAAPSPCKGVAVRVVRLMLDVGPAAKVSSDLFAPWRAIFAAACGLWDLDARLQLVMLKRQVRRGSG
jgi:hypothetical protein